MEHRTAPTPRQRIAAALFTLAAFGACHHGGHDFHGPDDLDAATQAPDAAADVTADVAPIADAGQDHWDSPLPALPAGCQVDVRGLELVQATTQRLWPARAVGLRHTPLIAGKAAHVVARVAAETPPAQTNTFTARLRVHSEGKAAPLVLEQVHALLPSRSPDAAAETVLRFALTGDQLTPGVRFTLELFLWPGCESPSGLPGLRVPALDPAPADLATPGGLRIKLVPIRYRADGSDRVPEPSPIALSRLQRHILALYPVQSVHIEVREPVLGTPPLREPSDWDAYLELIRRLRIEDAAPDDVYYVGLVKPTRLRNQFCQPDCQAGTAFLNVENVPEKRAAALLGDLDALGLDLFVHELGHAHGLGHAPCAASAFVDPEFPHPNGQIGVEGWNRNTCSFAKADRPDFMGNCAGGWISDYHHLRLLDRISAVNGRSGMTLLQDADIDAPQCAPEPQPTPGVVAIGAPVPPPPAPQAPGPLESAAALSLGARDDELVTAIAIDPGGDVVVAGNFSGAFALGAARLESDPYEGGDIFIAKLDRTGGTKWAVRAGGDGIDSVSAVAVDGQGRIHVAGSFSESARFGHLLATAGPGPQPECFVARLSPDGAFETLAITRKEWHGAGCQPEVGLAIDGEGQAVVSAGFTGQLHLGSSLTVRGDSSNPQNTDSHVLVARLDYAGRWQWARSTGSGKGTVFTSVVAIDRTGAKITAASSVDIEAPTSFWGGTLEAPDIVVARFDGGGTTAWVTSSAGAGTEIANAIVMDADGNAYVAGRYYGELSLGDTRLPYPLGGAAALAARLDDDGRWRWARGGLGMTQGSHARANAAALLQGGVLAIGGFYVGTGDLGGLPLPAGDSAPDALLASLRIADGQWLTAGAASGGGHEVVTALAVAPEGGLWAAGQHGHPSLAPSQSSSYDGTLLMSAGLRDGFVWKLQP